MKVVHIVGARPQFIKLAPLMLAFNEDGHEQLTIHTGQHFDDAMSKVFFDELDIPSPNYNLEVHSLPHGAMTGRMLEGIEKILIAETPDVVIVYGDTDSTLAGALAASKLGIFCAHVEAGLRSFNRSMPEEQNRIATDHLADVLFAPTQTAMAHLANEGLQDRAVLVGDVMYDAVLHFGEKSTKTKILERLSLSPEGYFLATLHRAATTDNHTALGAVIAALDEISRDISPVVMPLHPRTRQALKLADVKVEHMRLVEPVSYLEMQGLLRGCRAVLTDSGGLQKEAYFVKKMCFTLRDETEWVETVDCGANVLCGLRRERIVSAVGQMSGTVADARFGLGFYGQGDACDLIAEVFLDTKGEKT